MSVEVITCSDVKSNSLRKQKNGTYLDTYKLYLHSFFYSLLQKKTHNILNINHYSYLFALLAKIKI